MRLPNDLERFLMVGAPDRCLVCGHALLVFWSKLAHVTMVVCPINRDHERWRWTHAEERAAGIDVAAEA